MKGVQRSAGMYTHFLGHRQLNVLRSTCSSLVNNSLIAHRAESERYQKSRNLFSSSLCFTSVVQSKVAQVVSNVESRSDSINTTPVNTKTSSIETKMDSSQAVLKYTGPQNVDSILTAATTSVHSLAQTCNFLLLLGNVVGRSPTARSDAEELKLDERFKKICSIIEQADFQTSPYLLHALKGLYAIGLEDGALIKGLENDLKWIVRRCPTIYIARAIDILSTQTSSMDTSKTKLNSNHPLIVTIETLQRRWVEVTTGSDFIATFKVISSLNDETRLKLEDRVVEVLQDFSTMENIKLFIVLGSQKRRTTPVLRALSFHLSKSKEKVSPKDLIELLFALNELTFADPLLMTKICGDLKSEIVNINSSSLISSLITSLGQMRYKDKELLLAVEEWIMNHLQQLRPFDCASWLLASSVFDIQSENTTKFCNLCKEVLTQETSRSAMSWINIVHALVILKQADSSTMSSVLDPTFVVKMDVEGKFVPQKLRLLQINAASKHLKGYNGPYIAPHIVSKWTSAIVKCTDADLSKAVIETLGNFLPPPKYLLEGKQLSSGVFVDAVCMLNAKSDPVPVTTKSQDTTHRVAIVVQGYFSHCTGTREPTGSTSLAVRLVQQEGYHVITVPYTEFNSKEKLIRKVQYLEQKIRSINLTDVASSQSNNIDSKK